MTRTYAKPALTFDQQIDRLIERGLLVEDRDRAREALRRINYYRLSAYWRVFKLADDSFHHDGSFDRALALYEFDRKLRLLTLDMVERVEIALRCEIAYYLGHEFGPYSHEDPATFVPGFRHAEWVEELHRDTTRSREVFVRHFEKTYDGFPSLPVWVAAEVMSFRQLSRTFKGLKTLERTALASPRGVSHQVLETWLHSVAFVRNVCAHHARLWNKDLAINPLRPRGRPDWDEASLPNMKRVYSVLCVLRHLSRNDPCGDTWAARVAELLGIMDGNARFQRMMGLPETWRSSPFWSGL